MAWVQSEYAGELAVISTWLVSLLPWSVSWIRIGGVSAVSLRFPFVRLQYIFGAKLPGEEPFLWVWEVPAFAGSPELTLAAQLGLLGAAVYLLALAGSLIYYVAEDWVERQPADPVLILGSLLGLVGLTLTVAGVILFRFDAAAVVPAGGPIVLVLGYLLITVDRT
jgi:uncharacterized protein (TIGR04206 family)